MARSKNACLSILACTGGGGGGGGGGEGGGTAVSPPDAGDGRSDESKAMSDKSRWSFRRRSTRHRVLKNTEISEPEAVNSNKEIPDVITNSFYLPKCSPAPEKTLEQEKPNLDELSASGEAHSEAIDSIIVAERKGSSSNENHLDAAAVVIQAGIRAYLARRELLKLKGIVELQAAIRGDLIRREAVETLHCLIGIIKIQALVLAHQSKQFAEKFSVQSHEIFQVKGRSGMQEITKCTCEKLLLNAYVRQIMAMPRTRAMGIKCDPLKSDSAWTWLERWTVVTSSNIRQSLEQESNELADMKALLEVPTGDDTLLYDSNIITSESDPTNCKGILDTENLGPLELHAPVCVPDKTSGTSMKMNQELELMETETVAEKASTDFLCSTALQTDASKGSNSLLDEAPSYTDAPKNASKIEPLEAAGKMCLTRKPCNPAFAAAQLKFQELSSNSTVNRSTNSSSSCPDGVSKVKSFGLHSQVDASMEVNNESCLSENSMIHDVRVQNAASECGTEISISSTPDSPDRSETEGGEIVLEIGSVEKRDYDNNGGAKNETSLVDTHDGVKNSSVGLETQQVKRLEEEDKDAAVDPVQVEQHAEVASFEAQDQLEKSLESQGRLSVEGTPGSRTESHGTPSSQISLNTKKSKKDGGVPTQRRMLNTASKRSLSSPNSEPVGRNSTENLSQDLKNVKRQNSTGMAGPDPSDHEPRMSNSHPLPSYMQATESARAKVHASISPKPSPDTHDNHVKKRHSLPVGNGKQDLSPCMKRSTSQAQKNSKVNDTPHNSAERTWQL